MSSSQALGFATILSMARSAHEGRRSEENVWKCMRSGVIWQWRQAGIMEEHRRTRIVLLLNTAVLARWECAFSGHGIDECHGGSHNAICAGS